MLCVVAVVADLRLGSQPRKRYAVKNYAGSIPFVVSKAVYMEPQIFGYQVLFA